MLLVAKCAGPAKHLQNGCSRCQPSTNMRRVLMVSNRQKRTPSAITNVIAPYRDLSVDDPPKDEEDFDESASFGKMVRSEGISFPKKIKQKTRCYS